MTTFISPGFTEFMPETTFSRVLAVANGLVGVTVNGLFISILVARFLVPRDPLVIVPFLLYDPTRKVLTARLYSSLPENLYNIRFKVYRFVMFNDELGRQMGGRVEILSDPAERNLLHPNYGILVKIKVDFEGNPQHTSPKRKYLRKKMPVEWLLSENDRFPEGYVYLVVEAETAHGKVFQVQDYYLNKNYIRCGRHVLLNEGIRLRMRDWYQWRQYRWDLWGRYEEIVDVTEEHRDKMWEVYSGNDM